MDILSNSGIMKPHILPFDCFGILTTYMYVSISISSQYTTDKTLYTMIYYIHITNNKNWLHQLACACV